MPNWIPNFNKLEITIEIGTIIRGKYTFPKIPALAPKVLEVPVRQAVKQFQTVIPAKLNKKGGTVPVLIPAKLLKIIVNVIEVNSGCIKYHSGPKTVCL